MMIPNFAELTSRERAQLHAGARRTMRTSIG